MKALKIPSYLICYLIYPFSFLFPRSGSKRAFGSFRGAFEGNAKYLFLRACGRSDGRRNVWLTTSRETAVEVRALGLEAYTVFSPKGALYALTSGYWFFDSDTADIMWCLSGGAVCVNLWHGVGLKRTGFNVESGPVADRFRNRKLREVFFHPEALRKPDWLISSSPFQTSMFAKAFGIPESRCIEAGYPRNEALRRRDERFNPGTYRKIFVYMPTWRDSQREIFTQRMDLAALDAALKANGDLLLLKPHVNTVLSSGFEGFTNIRLIDAKTDIYPILPFTDVLITDYSSILYDYILMEGKSVILYLYDYDTYVKERDFYYPFDENVIGERVTEFADLLRLVKQTPPLLDEGKRVALVEKFWGKSAEGDPSDRILELFAK